MKIVILCESHEQRWEIAKQLKKSKSFNDAFPAVYNCHNYFKKFPHIFIQPYVFKSSYANFYWGYTRSDEPEQMAKHGFTVLGAEQFKFLYSGIFKDGK